MTSSNSNSTRFSIDDAWSEKTSIQQAENDNNDVMVAGIPIQFFVGTTAQEVAQEWLMSSARARTALEIADKQVFSTAQVAWNKHKESQLVLAKKDQEQKAIQQKQQRLVESFQQGTLDLAQLDEREQKILENALTGRELREFKSELRQLDLLKKVQQTETALLGIAKTSKSIEGKIDSNKLMTQLLLRLPALREEADRLSKNKVGLRNQKLHEEYLAVIQKYQDEFLSGNPDIPGTLAEFIIWFNAQALERMPYSNNNWLKKAIQAAGGILIDEEKIQEFADKNRKF
jgi:hypothetical protein